MFNTELLMQHLRRGREPVSGATAVADHKMFLRIVILMVHAHHHGDVVVFRRSGDDDPLCAAVGNMHRRFFAFGEEAGGFNDNIHAHTVPGDFRRIAMGEHFYCITVNSQLAFARLDRQRQGAEQGVVFQQVRQRFAVGQVVNRHDLDLFIIQGGAENVAPDAAKAVNTDLHHNCLLMCCF